jgi:hypothetical protein
MVWVLIPGFDPFADVGLQRPPAFVHAAAKKLVGEVAEPAFALVDPHEPVGVKCRWKLGVGSARR